MFASLYTFYKYSTISLFNYKKINAYNTTPLLHYTQSKYVILFHSLIILNILIVKAKLLPHKANFVYIIIYHFSIIQHL